jgi:hypothetical protein
MHPAELSKRPIALFACLAAILTFASGSVETAYADDFPQTVEGPITGPGPMHPWIRNGPEGTNLEDFDYLVEEYFVSGMAAGASYKVRMLIRKPKNPNQFSGMVVGEPTHRGGNTLICQYARFGIGHRGHACMGVGARPINHVNNATPGAGLHQFNFERYGSLHVANNQQNEILAQVGRLIKSNLGGGPMGDGYHVRTMILGGTSDSSGAARNYMSSDSMLDHADLRMPDAGPIYDGFFLTSTLGGTPVALVDVPTIQMPSQSEVHSRDDYRQPDSDEAGAQLRIYEPAAMTHNDARENPAFSGCANPLSHYPHGALTFMGLQHLLDWATHGTLPPRAKYIEVDGIVSEEDHTRVALDEFGNAKGGVRSTYVDVPAFTFTVPNTGPGLCSQTGYITPLPDATLKALYRNYGGYVSKVRHRLKELIDQGWFPKEYAQDYVQRDLKLSPQFPGSQ